MYSIQKKITQLRYWIGLAFLLIIARLIYLQIVLAHELKYKSERNFLRWQHIPSLRGDIVDMHERLLATNRPIVDLCWQASSDRMQYPAIQALLDDITARIGISFEDPTLLRKIRWAERIGTTIPIAVDINFQTLVKLKEHYADHPIIVTKHRFARYYPHQQSACHLVGYLSTVDPDISGKMGLEKLLNDILKGEHGQTLTVINAVGTPINQVAVQDMQPGITVQTTLDLDLQLMIESLFTHDSSGSFILMEPSTGALRALVSRPAFDPSMFLRSITQQQWQHLQELRPFLNRALDTAYPPGSIFKLVTISAALEHEYIDKDSHWYCRGYSTFCDRRYYCHKKQGHGKLSVLQAVAYSCNPLFFELGKQMDIDLIANYATLFGLGEPTGIALSEHKGLVPTRSWKRRTKGESWWQGETLSACIGQSFLLVTPIQVARMIASIFTGYLVQPRILEAEPVVKTPLMLHTSTLDFLRTSMRSVVTSGTGRQVNRIHDMEIYAKTATAQTSALEKRESGLLYREHGWFVCHFNYKNGSPLVMVVLLENVGSSREAVKLAYDFLMLYKKYIDENQAQKNPLIGLRVER